MTARRNGTGLKNRWTLEPWSEAVNGAELLDDIRAFLERHVVFPVKHAAVAAALWVLYTYVYELFDVSPRFGITSATKRSGKTRLLQCLGKAVSKSYLTSNLTTAVVFRLIDENHPTLLIDEMDTFLSERQELRGILNSGHSRDTAWVSRCVQVGNTHTVMEFDTFGPMAIAMIGQLPPTLHDRAIVIRMARKKPGMRVARLRHETESAELRQRSARWAADSNRQIENWNTTIRCLTKSGPGLPELSNGRALDNWEVLTTIADIAGGDWPSLARAAAIALTPVDTDDGAGAMLLGDLRDLFEGTDEIQPMDWITSRDLARHLNRLAGRPWAQWGRSQKPINEWQIARLLKEFEIRPGKLRDERGPRGYGKEQFADVFERYLAPVLGEGGCRPEQPEQTCETRNAPCSSCSSPEGVAPGNGASGVPPDEDPPPWDDADIPEQDFFEDYDNFDGFGPELDRHTPPTTNSATQPSTAGAVVPRGLDAQGT